MRRLALSSVALAVGLLTAIPADAARDHGERSTGRPTRDVPASGSQLSAPTQSPAPVAAAAVVPEDGSAAMKAAGSAASSVERVISGMRNAEERIARKETGDETRQLQREVVDELDKLIELARQARQTPPSSPQSQSQQQQQRQQQEQDTEQEANSDSESSQAPALEQERSDPDTSEPRDRTAPDGQLELFRQQQLVDEVWGHLPERLRQKLRNVYSEKTLPQYEDLVKRYFEALAEEPKKNR